MATSAGALDGDGWWVRKERARAGSARGAVRSLDRLSSFLVFGGALRPLMLWIPERYANYASLDGITAVQVRVFGDTSFVALSLCES